MPKRQNLSGRSLTVNFCLAPVLSTCFCATEVGPVALEAEAMGYVFLFVIWYSFEKLVYSFLATASAGGQVELVLEGPVAVLTRPKLHALMVHGIQHW